MTLMLGVDTKETCTDAVLIRDNDTVMASAKSLTPREDLAIGTVPYDRFWIRQRLRRIRSR